jgi:hypothetical protein
LERGGEKEREREIKRAQSQREYRKPGSYKGISVFQLRVLDQAKGADSGLKPGRHYQKRCNKITPTRCNGYDNGKPITEIKYHGEETLLHIEKKKRTFKYRLYKYQIPQNN